MGGDTRGRIFSNVTVFNGLSFERGQSLLIDSKGQAFWGPTSNYKPSTVADQQSIDATGMTVTPSFHDTHTHLLSYASNFQTYDIGLEEFSEQVFIKLLRRAAYDQENSGLVRVSGMDRYFTNIDSNFQIDKDLLDEALPDRPLRIQTRSGHAHVLNSAAMRLAGIGESTDEPEGVTFQRRLSDGELNGVFLEAGEYLDGRLPKIDQCDLEKGLAKALNTIHAKGINDVTDATHINDFSRYEFLSECVRKYAPNMKLQFMPGFNSIRDFLDLGMKYKSQHNGVSLGPVKLMVTDSHGSIYPDKNTLKEMVRESHRFGFPVAIHSVEMNSTDIILEILGNDRIAGDRIEHASELRDDQIQKISEMSLKVSTQPSFIYERGDGYLNSDSASRIDKLYRLKSLLFAGVIVGVSSDCPVTDPNPMNTIYSAVTRRTSTGAIVNIEERVSICEALQMLTTNNVTLAGLNRETKWMDKNLLLIDKDFDTCSSHEILKANVSWITEFD